MATYSEKQMENRRRAVRNYQKTVDRINCLLPLGTKDRIKDLTGKSCNSFISECVLAELDRLEKEKK